jgi:hypothetical protein
MVKRFQFGPPVCFFQYSAFTSSDSYIDNNRLIEPAKRSPQCYVESADNDKALLYGYANVLLPQNSRAKTAAFIDYRKTCFYALYEKMRLFAV